MQYLQGFRMWVQGLGFRDLTPMAENQMQKNMQDEKERVV